MTKEHHVADAAFDVSELDMIDADEMEVRRKDGTPTGWKWKFAGPGHERTIEQRNRLARERIRREQAWEQAQVNGRKFKSPDESPEERFQNNIRLITDRLLDWSLVHMDGQPFPCTPENARAYLSDARRAHIFEQAMQFLQDEKSFTARSEKG
jgi:hypothetical protein